MASYPLNFKRTWTPTNDSTATLVPCSGAGDLVTSIRQYWYINVCKTVVGKFNNGEINVELGENVRNKHAFVVCPLRTGRINDDCMELFLIIDACNRSDVKEVTVILPYFPYARSDKKDKPHVPISATVITRFLETLGVKNVISLDLHAAQLQGLMSKGFHNLYIKNSMCEALIREGYFSATDHAHNATNFVFVAPDAGSIKRTEAYAEAFGINYIILHKQRDYGKPGTVKRSILIANTPDIYRDKTAVIIDDIGDTMGTMIAAIQELVAAGVKDVIIGLSHGVFSTTPDGITAIEKITNCTHIRAVFITNSLTQPTQVTCCPKIYQICIGQLLACTIDGILTGKSVSHLVV